MKKRIQVLATIGILSLAVTAPLTYAEDDSEIRPLASMDDEIAALSIVEDEEETEAETVAETNAEETAQSEEQTTEAETTPAEDAAENAEDGETSDTEQTEVNRSESTSKSSKKKDEDEDEDEEESEETEETVEIIGFYLDPNAYPPADQSETTKVVYKYLREELGLNHAGACGILANMHMESGFSQFALGDGGTSYGLCQWHNERFNSLISYCNSTGQDYNTVEGQLDFMKHELETLFPTVYSYVKNVEDTAQGAYNAANYWCIYYESPQYASANGVLRGNLAANEYYPMDFSYNEDLEAANSMIADIRASMDPKTDDEESEDDDMEIIESVEADAEAADATEEDPLEAQAEQTMNALFAIRDSLDAE